MVLAAALGEPLPDPAKAFTAEARRRQRAAKGQDPLGLRLERAADAFLYKSPVSGGSTPASAGCA